MSSRHTHSTVCKSSLSPARQQLLGLIQRINFGRVERLVIREGEPVLDPMPVITAEIKFAGENGARLEAGFGDFALKRHHLELFALLDAIGTGELPVLTIRHGLPFSAERVV